jgi:hypothetical protein
LRDAYLVIVPHLTFDFDSHASTFVGVADVSVVDLNRIDGLNKICVFTMDVNQVTDIHVTIGQFNNPAIYSGIIVNNTAYNSFSYANGHAPTSLYVKILTLRGTLIFKTQGVCRAGTSSEGGLVSRLVCDP